MTILNFLYHLNLKKLQKEPEDAIALFTENKNTQRGDYRNS